MRPVVVLLLLAAAGFVGGKVLARWELGSQTVLTLPGTGDAPGAKPKFAIDATEFNFGTAEPTEPLEHSFVVTNEGSAPLTLVKGETTCFCTLSSVKQAVLAPGQKTEITLKWHGDKPGLFRQHATILSNDPRNHSVALTVYGKISPIVAVVPEVLALGRLRAGEPKTVDVRLYGFQTEPLKLRQVRLLDGETAEYFTVQQQPLPAAELQEMDAHSGWKVRVTLKSGLRFGPVRQTIRLLTDSTKAEFVDVPFSALIVGDITVVGERWDADQDTLFLGTLKRQQGRRATVRVLVAGEHKDNTRISVQGVKPGYLQAKIGESSDLSQGSRRQTSVEVEVPAGSPVENHLGGEQGSLGEIVLATTHPDVPTVKLHVRFAVED